MSTAVKQFHEEEAIGKTYDFQVARRLLRYLKPYVRLLVPALVFTLLLNLLGTHPARLRRLGLRPLQGIAGIGGQQTHADEEAVEAAQAGDAGTDRDRGRLLA